MADNILKIRRLNKTYFGKVDTPVLFDIDLQIVRGSFTALIGPSGSGKSTLLHCLGLLDPQTSGEIDFDGTMITSQNVNALADFRNANIGFIFQFHYLLPEYTAHENILLPCWIRGGKPSPETEKEALRIMERIGIENLKNKYISELSGGQQQRVSIARALINKPKLIFADEPTGNLDRESGHAVLDLMAEINHESNISLVMVTHDREVALRADYIYELVDGRICKFLDVAKIGKTESAKAMAERTCAIEPPL
ncbi:MAG: ABC transporter ATP-binding protein [Candidatus Aminicenantes bacterium]|nr:ABC transporter ATP-binding protein [Candidatus Aminicenantes bacterium]